MNDDVLTRNENEELAVRTVVSSGDNYVDPNDVYTRDANGNLCVRVTGSGGGGVDENKVIVKSATIPEASADELGKFYCYSGETNSSFTHGYVYECVEGQPTYTDSVEFEPASVSGTVVTATSNSLANLCAEYITGDITSIVSGTMTYDESGDIWVFVGKDAEDNTVGSFQLYTQDFIDAGFTFTGTLQDGDVVAFTCTITESSTYVWERLNLQPEAKLGRYLSSWNCATGLAGTNPPESPYEYITGDYFIVNAVATGDANNYKPNGSSYVIGQASTTVESSTVAINDTYLYDGTNWTLLKTGSTVTSVNGQTGDVTVQETLVSGTNIKTINGNTVLGSGNLELTSSLAFPAGWTTGGTTKAFCDDVAADTSAVAGKMYLGEVTFSDLPASIANSEVEVKIMYGTTAQNKVILLELTSGNVAPYKWQYTYWNGGADVSGWIGFQQQLTAGANITISGSTISATDTTYSAMTGATAVSAGTSGLVPAPAAGDNDKYLKGDGSWGEADALPSQTGNAGKVLKTNGTVAGWEDTSTSPTTLPLLVVANWVLNQQNNKYEQTVNCAGVTASNTVFVGPSPVNTEEWGQCGVYCYDQGAGTLSFRCDTVPQNALSVNVIIV